MNVLDAFAVNEPCSERGPQLLLRTMAIFATSVVLGIDQLLLELAVRGTDTRGQTAIAGRVKVLPGCNRCSTGDVEVDGLIGRHTIRQEQAPRYGA